MPGFTSRFAAAADIMINSLALIRTTSATLSREFRSNLGPTLANSLNNSSAQLRTFREQLNATGREISKIVSGIIISQAFYRLTGQIEGAAWSIYNFIGNMQLASISMETFLGYKSRADAFLMLMQDFAAVTPYTTEQAVNMARRLMAMSFDAKNVKPVLSILTDTAAATGGTAEQMNRIVLALGQMKTNGKIAGQEIRQLAEAGIPAYKILQEKLGLTYEQMGQIGKLHISGDIGVAAILQGLEERYKGTAEKVANTIPGMMSTIQDDFLIISQNMFEQSYGLFSKYITSVRDKFESLREVTRKYGMGGFFEAVIPKKFQDSIRLIVALFRYFIGTLKLFYQGMEPIITQMRNLGGGLLLSVITTLNILLRALVKLHNILLNNVTPLRIFYKALIGLLIVNLVSNAFFLFWKVLKIGAIINLITVAVLRLVSALKLLAIVAIAHPIAAILAIIASVVGVLAVRAYGAAKAIDTLKRVLAGVFGLDVSKILQPFSNPKIPFNTSEFETPYAGMNTDLSNVGKSLEKIGDSADKASKKLKDGFLASFDEIFAIPDQTGDLADELSDDLSDMIPDDSSIMGPNVDWAGIDEGMIDSSDFAKWMSEFDDFGIGLSDIWEKIKGVFEKGWAILRLGWASFISTMGDVFSGLWNSIKNGFGGIVSWIVDKWDRLIEFIKSNWEESSAWLRAAFIALGVAWAYLMVTFKSLWSGAWIGIKNIFSDWRNGVGIIWDGFKNLITGGINRIQDAWKFAWDTMKNLLGSWKPIVQDILSSFGSFANSVWESIGNFFANIWTKMIEYITSFKSTADNLWDSVRVKGPEAFEALKNVATYIIDLIKAGWENVKTAFEALIKVIAETAIWNTLKDTATKAINGIKDAFNNLKNKFGELITDIGKSEAWENLKKLAGEVASSLWEKWNNVKVKITDLWKEISLTKAWEGISKLGSETASTLSEAWGKVKGAVTELGTKLGDIAWKTVTEAGQGAATAIKTTWEDLKKLFDNAWPKLGEGISTMWKGVAESLKGVLNTIISLFNNAIEAINKMKVSIPSWIPGIGGKTFAPSIPKIPMLANGGIVTQDGLYRMGEGNKREAVIPLENSQALAPLIEGIVSPILGAVAATKGDNIQVGTVITSARDFKELVRLVKREIMKESNRAGGGLNA